MASNGLSPRLADPALDQIKRQLASSSGRNLLQGPLFKRELLVQLALGLQPYILKAHKEAVDSLSGSGSSTLGTVATVVTAANSTALECSKEIQAAIQVSLRNALNISAVKPIDGPLDDLTIMKETLRVKDEELQNLARELRSRDPTIKEIADKLSETAEAAVAAASAAHTMDEQREIVSFEFEHFSKYSEKQQEAATLKVKELEEKTSALSKEKDQFVKERDSALQETHMWRSELAKARERIVILEGAVVL